MAQPEVQPAFWRRSWLVLLPSILLLPPVGLILLWLRPWPSVSVLRKIVGFLGRLALSAALVVLTLIYAVKFGVVHMEMSGAAWKPMFTLRDPKADQDALERHRAQQAASAPGSNANAEARSAAPDTAQQASPAPTAAKETTANARETAASPPLAAPYWTDFRGPQRDGIYTETPILTAWPADGLKPLWRQPVGGGYASFAVAQGMAFTIEQRRDNEVVAAYDLQTGRELWTNSWAALFRETMGGDGPRATPTWNDGRLYALGATGKFRCLDAATGQLLWSHNILDENGAQNISWGMAASPLVVNDKVIVLPGGGGGKSVVAYNKVTGEVVWRSLNDQQAYTSPAVVTLAGKRQLLIVSAERVMGLTVEEGKLLWEFPWTTMYGVNSAQPIVTDANHVFISAGYDHGAALLEITVQGDRFSARPVWQNNQMKNRFNGSVLYQGHIYGFDEAIFACMDAKTGERKWKGGRYGYGQVLLAGDRLILLAESGDLVLLRATPEKLDELARFSAVEGKTWNVPAISGGILLVRNTREMAAFRIAP